MARAASPQSGSGIRMQSQWDLNGGDGCSSFPLLIASKSRQLSEEGYCVKAVCNRLLMLLCVCRQTRRSGMESLSSTLDHFTILLAHPGSSFGRGGWHHPSFQITPLFFLQNMLLPFLKSLWLPEEQRCSVRGITALQPALELNQPPTEAAGST